MLTRYAGRLKSNLFYSIFSAKQCQKWNKDTVRPLVTRTWYSASKRRQSYGCVGLKSEVPPLGSLNLLFLIHVVTNSHVIEGVKNIGM